MEGIDELRLSRLPVGRFDRSVRDEILDDCSKDGERPDRMSDRWWAEMRWGKDSQSCKRYEPLTVESSTSPWRSARTGIVPEGWILR